MAKDESNDELEFTVGEELVTPEKPTRPDAIQVTSNPGPPMPRSPKEPMPRVNTNRPMDLPDFPTPPPRVNTNRPMPSRVPKLPQAPADAGDEAADLAD